MKQVIFYILVLFAGCYTVIKHPDVDYEGSSGEIYTSHISYRSNCIDCHSPSELSYFYALVPAHNSSPWAYYNIPWWFEWWNNLADTNQAIAGGASPPERVRSFGSHRGSNASDNLFSPPPPTRTPPGSNDSTGSVSSGSMRKVEKDSTRVRSSGENSSGRSREQQDKDKEGKRNIGSRRK